MRKRLLSLALALAVCLALAVPALADVSGSWDSIYWMADSAQSGEDVLAFMGSGTLSGVKNHMDPYLEDWDLMDYYNGGQFSWFDVGGSINRIADGAFEGYTQMKGIRIGSSVKEIGDIFGSTLGSLTNQPVLIYGAPGSAAEDFVTRTNGKNPGTLLFLDSSAYELGEDPNAASADACGENTTWSFDRETDTLTISGAGSTADFESGAGTPWMKNNAYPRRVVVEEGVARLGNRIFAGLANLTSVSLPSALTEIGEGTFMDCSRDLTSITLPANLTAIGKYAFFNCRELKSIAIPGGVTRLETDTFAATGLTSAYIPASVTFIDCHAFRACESLTDVYYEGTAEQWARIEVFGYTAGEDDITAVFPSTVNIHYSSYTPAIPTNPAASETPGGTEPEHVDYNIVPTSSTVLVNGANVVFDAYNINGANYFKLRDLAMALNGSAKQFEVSWDAAANAISLTSNAAYTAVGGELAAGNGDVEAFRPTDSNIILDGTEISLEAFNINGSNYFKLRDIGQAFDFGIGWDDGSKTITIDTSKGYTA